MKIPKSHFERFKKAFTKLQTELGLMQYRITFEHKKLDRAFAKLYSDQKSKSAIAILNTEIDDDTIDEYGTPEESAVHEVIHLLLSRLVWLGESRYLFDNEIDEEDESIVRRLERLLGGRK